MGFSIFIERIEPSIQAKSVVFDIADNWGAGYLGFMQVDFLKDGEIITNTTSDFTAYANSEFSPAWVKEFAFQTDSVGKWMGPSNTNVRIICVFDEVTIFDRIEMYNFWTTGGYETRGGKNTKVTITDNAITDTTYNAAVSGGTTYWDGELQQNTGGTNPQYLDFQG